MPLTSVHTVIIGAGPAGLAAAAALAETGTEVVVLERLARVGPKPCAGGIPAASLDPALPPDLIERSFHHQRVVTNSQDFQLAASGSIISTIDREKLGSWMRQRAEAAGARIICGVRARQIKERRLLTDQGDFEFRYLVGADGSNSLVRRHLGLPLQLAGIGITYQLPGHFSEMEWHLNQKLFGNGYAWIFPHRDSASVGVYAYRNALRSPLLHDRFRSWAAERGLDLEAGRPRAALVSFDYRGARFGNLLLAGDAAGLASGLTGEGIAAALHSGRAAAEAILAGDQHHPELSALMRRHSLHRRLATLTAGHPFCNRLIMETLALALRCRLLDHSALELLAAKTDHGDHRGTKEQKR